MTPLNAVVDLAKRSRARSPGRPQGPPVRASKSGEKMPNTSEDMPATPCEAPAKAPKSATGPPLRTAEDIDATALGQAEGIDAGADDEFAISTIPMGPVVASPNEPAGHEAAT